MEAEERSERRAGRPSNSAGPGPGQIRSAGGNRQTQEPADCCLVSWSGRLCPVMCLARWQYDAGKRGVGEGDGAAEAVAPATTAAPRDIWPPSRAIAVTPSPVRCSITAGGPALGKAKIMGRVSEAASYRHDQERGAGWPGVCAACAGGCA